MHFPYRVISVMNGERMYAGYGPTYAAALKDCEVQHDREPIADCIMLIENPQGQKFKLTYAEAKKFNF